MVNFTNVLFPISVMLAVLLTTKTTETTSTVAFASNIVLFSSQPMDTVLFHLPVAFDLATIQ